MKIAPESTTSLASEVYGIVRRRILKGDLSPGQPISRRTVAAEVRTSLLPVAEAMQRLEFEGLLESRPRSGTRVRIPSREDVTGHYIVREALEVQVAMRVAVVATARELDRLRELAEHVDAMDGRSDQVAYAAAHHGFHRRMAECSRCRALADALEQTHAVAVLWLARTQGPSLDESPGCHRQLVEALSARDPVVAAEAVRRHIALGLERSMQALEPYFSLTVTGRRSFRRGRRPKASIRRIERQPRADTVEASPQS